VPYQIVEIGEDGRVPQPRIRQEENAQNGRKTIEHAGDCRQPLGIPALIELKALFGDTQRHQADEEEGELSRPVNLKNRKNHPAAFKNTRKNLWNGEEQDGEHNGKYDAHNALSFGNPLVFLGHGRQAQYRRSVLPEGRQSARAIRVQYPVAISRAAVLLRHRDSAQSVHAPSDVSSQSSLTPAEMAFQCRFSDAHTVLPACVAA